MPYNNRKPKIKPAKGKRARLTATPESKLGRFILAQTPYPKPIAPSPSKAAGMKKYGPGKEFTTAHPYLVADVRPKLTKANPLKLSAKAPKKSQDKFRRLTPAGARRILKEGFYWKIGGVKRRMSKVIRIPYRYTDPLFNQKTTAALIIAWEGAGGGC